ncbi:hypothetical protein Bca52824_001117 [Brassica carinata]|uniref:Agenet domain-containing protein n=1 Tax=Brassica carinata TaxID=52824 RepID=A0A8X8BDJ9_BRACI|nr:hypothetical protein Bca52824_001117 [Brassica carinata]
MCLEKKRSLSDFISKMKKLKKGSDVEVTCEKEMFKVSWNKAILQENPAKMKGKKLRVCFTTLVDKDSLSPYTETVEQCFIRPVQPEYLNKGFVFERGSVVDAYAHAGWWKSVIVKELPNDKFLVYFDFIPDIAKFDKNQLRPNADWTGSKWELSEDIYSPGKIVEMTRRIRKMEDIWITALLIKQIEVDGERKFIIKRLTQLLRLSDDDEEEAIFKTVDICKIRPCPPQYFFAKHILGDIVEVFVSCGWRQGEVREILCGNQYLVQFNAAKEEAVYKSSALRPSMDWQDGSWIHTRERKSIEETHSKGTSKSKNDDATPLISPQESPSNTHVLDGAEDDLMNDAPTATHESSSSTLVLESNEDEIVTPEESYSNTTVLEATENPISHESGDTMNDDATSPIINPQKIPIAGTEDDLINDAPTPTIATQERSSSTLVLESNEDDMMNGYATEIITHEESYSNTTILEATDNETPIGEAVVAFKLPLPHESDDTMNDDASSPISEAQKIPIGNNELEFISHYKTSLSHYHTEIVSGETMTNSDDKIALPKRVIEPGTEERFLARINKRSNLKLVDDKTLWFSFGEQAIRFSLREFHFATGLPCVVHKDEEKVETSRRKKKKKDPWMNKDQTVKSLFKLLENNSTEFTADQRLRLGASILVEGILMAINPVTRIPVKNLLRARDFKEFCKYPWGNLAFDCLRDEVKGITSEVENEIKFPLCLHWIKTKPLTMEEVDVKCILGDPEMHSDLVEDVDIQFGRVVDIVKRGYRLKRQDWINGSVNIAVAEAEIEKNNYGPGIDATNKEKNEFLNKQVEILKERVEYLENLLNIPRETEKVETLEVQQVDDDTEVSDKESETSKINEDGELNENASKEPVLLKRKKKVRENKGAYASRSNSKQQKKQSGVPADVVI